MCVPGDMQTQKEADFQDESVCLVSLPLQLQLFIYVLVTGAEVGGEGGHWGGKNNRKKKICVSK